MEQEPKCPGCRAVPRMYMAAKAADGLHLHYKCVNKQCRNCGREVAERVVPPEGAAEESSAGR
ncbi:hypothetical protein JQM64_06060 [Fournierella massiliensis]|nr:hypothetical protein [Fournierella massiliensis]MCF2557083.1 hypothetical protein [Fournierella massiliensis]